MNWEKKSGVSKTCTASMFCKVHGLTCLIPSSQSIFLFTEMSHHIYYPHTEAGGQVNSKDYD